MLEDLPLEILEILIGHLPTASSVINLSLTNHKLHQRISSDKYALLKCFVQNRFPSIRTPPLWREATIALTARSRAWERRAFFARSCDPPLDDATSFFRARPGYRFGYIPVIDSYEIWPDSTWTNKHEVLAWGAGGRLRTRTMRNGTTSWSSWRTPNDQTPQQDILDVKLLRPGQNQNSKGETIILRRANKEIVKVESTPKPDFFLQKSAFSLDQDSIDCMDMNTSSHPLLATCDTKALRLFDVQSNEAIIQSAHTLTLEQKFGLKHRTRCARFLSEHTLALGIQFLEGRNRAPIQIYNINPSGITNVPLSAAYSIDAVKAPTTGRGCTNCISPLDDVSTSVGRPGVVFLSGWNDGVVRLYDLRTPMSPRSEYFDLVDDGQILSLLAIGHERFLAGSHQNACLKTFDLRMAGAHAYSYNMVKTMNQQPPAFPNLDPAGTEPPPWKLTLTQSNAQISRDINIFLAIPAKNLTRPAPHQRSRHQETEPLRYRGSIYSLSSPSPSSAAIYAGIENHVIQLDFISTDDLVSEKTRETVLHPPSHVLNLSCYERPRPGNELTDTILLRKQVDWNEGKDGKLTAGKAEMGWDERWRLATYGRLSRGENERRPARNR